MDRVRHSALPNHDHAIDAGGDAEVHGEGLTVNHVSRGTAHDRAGVGALQVGGGVQLDTVIQSCLTASN